MNTKKLNASIEPKFLHPIRFMNIDSRNEPQSQRLENYSNAISTTSALSNLPGFIALAEDNKNNNQAPDFYYMLSCAIESDGNMVQTFAAGVYIPGSTQGNGQGTGAFTNKAMDKNIVCPPNCKKILTVKNRMALP
jgi:hypothetical protein